MSSTTYQALLRAIAAAQAVEDDDTADARARETATKLIIVLNALSDSYADGNVEALDELVKGATAARALFPEVSRFEPRLKKHLDTETMATFTAFLGEHVKNPSCPVCEANDWEIVDPTTIGALPTVSLVCKSCCHVRSFAWLPILKGRKVST